MADVKISALPAATTPLVGTELVPIVQSGVTSRVSVANMTAGRSVAASTVTVDANSASDALRITQTGTGNALVVEDAANPDATPFIISSGGEVVVGNNALFAASTITPGFNLQGVGGTGGAQTVGIAAFGANAGGPVIYFGKSRGATVGSAGLVADGDFLGALFFEGSDGTVQRRGASIIANVDGTPGAADMPGRLVFNTTADGASSPTERMRISNAGFTTLSGSFGRGAPVTKTGNFTLANTENWLICNGAGSITVTFPAASSWTGREVMLKTIAAQTVVSASSNVVPLAGGAAGTAILAASAGAWATLVSDGTNWVIMQA